jgi:hypothetical protein
MAASLTEQEFAQHVGTKFQLKTDPEPIELNLVEVKGYASGPNDQKGLERFSLFFEGPGSIRLPQAVYRLEHELMGEFDIFLVPVGRDDQASRYEAVFNYFRE